MQIWYLAGTQLAKANGFLNVIGANIQPSLLPKANSHFDAKKISKKSLRNLELA